jgi:hypothetical protein
LKYHKKKHSNYKNRSGDIRSSKYSFHKIILKPF